MQMLKLIPETFYTVQEELLLLGGAVLLGIPAGIAWDCFRLLRRVLPHHWAAVMLEDIFYLIFVSFLLLCYASAFARGDFRMYYVIGCACGMVLYECILGRPVLRLWDSFARICKKLVASFVKHAKK